MGAVEMQTLTSSFQTQIDIVNRASIIFDSRGEIDSEKNFSELNGTTCALRSDLMNIRNAVNREKKRLKDLEVLKTQSTSFVERLQYVLDNIPSNLPQKKTSSSESSAPKQSAGSLVETNSAIKLGQATTSNISTPTGCVYLDFLKVDEFDSVPKYMKGRLTYNKVNSTIAQLDHVFIEKYKIRKQKKSSLNDVNRKRFEIFRQQENADTSGLHFIVEKDITDLSHLKVDNALRKIFTILRHCQIMFEIRGGGCVRFAAVPNRY